MSNMITLWVSEHMIYHITAGGNVFCQRSSCYSQIELLSKQDCFIVIAAVRLLFILYVMEGCKG